MSIRCIRFHIASDNLCLLRCREAQKVKFGRQSNNKAFEKFLLDAQTLECIQGLPYLCPLRDRLS